MQKQYPRFRMLRTSSRTLVLIPSDQQHDPHVLTRTSHVLEYFPLRRESSHISTPAPIPARSASRLTPSRSLLRNPHKSHEHAARPTPYASNGNIKSPNTAMTDQITCLLRRRWTMWVGFWLASCSIFGPGVFRGDT